MPLLTFSNQTQEASPYRVALVTCGSEQEAGNIAQSVVSEKLAACVNVIGPVSSTYFWEGSLEKASEFLLLVKTAHDLLPKLQERIQELHSYDVPEFIVLPIVAGSSDYLSWLAKGIHQ